MYKKNLIQRIRDNTKNLVISSLLASSLILGRLLQFNWVIKYVERLKLCQEKRAKDESCNSPCEIISFKENKVDEKEKRDPFYSKFVQYYDNKTEEKYSTIGTGNTTIRLGIVGL